LGGKGILIVGDAPGIQEDTANRVFVGSTGVMLRRLISQTLGNRYPIRYVNAVKCFPGSGDDALDVRQGIAVCRSHLQREIRQSKPERIIALGATAIQSLTGEPLRVNQVVEGWFRRSQYCDITTQFSYHPNAVFYNKALVPFWEQTFTRMLRKPPPSKWKHVSDVTVIEVHTVKKAIHVLRKAQQQKFVAYDVEYNKKTGRVLCYSLAWLPNIAYCLDDRMAINPKVVRELTKLFRTCTMAAHNWKFDAWVSVHCIGVPVEVFLDSSRWWFDTSTLRKLYHPEQDVDLDTAGWAVGMGGHKNQLFEILGRSHNGSAYEKAYNDYPQVVMNYCGKDSLACFRLVLHYAKALQREGLWPVWSEVFGPLGTSLFRMEANGLPIDGEAMAALDGRLKRQMNIELNAIRASKVVRRLCQRWDRKDEFNPKNPHHMRDLLFSKNGLGLRSRAKTPTGLPQVTKHVVKAASEASPILARISEFNRISSKHSTNVKGYGRRIRPETGCIHTDYRQDTARTQRLSSRDPNVQNIPNRGFVEDLAIRRVFVARFMVLYGCNERIANQIYDDLLICEADYSQQELRIGADLSNDEMMMHCFLHDIDIHATTASNILQVPIEEVTKPQRTAAKPINFGTIFNQSSRGLQAQAKKDYNVILSDDEAEMWRKGFFKLYRGYRVWMLREISRSKKRGCAYIYWEGKPFGRRWLPDLGHTDRGKRGHAERQSVNTPIQGGASLYTLKSLNMLHMMHYRGELPGVAAIMHTVHDSIWFAVQRAYKRRASKLIGQVMTSLPTVRVPLEVETKVGPNLADMKVVSIVNSRDAERKGPVKVFVTRRKAA